MTKLDELIELEVKLFPQKQLLRSLPENSKNGEIEFARKHCVEVINKIEAQIKPLKETLNNGGEIKLLEVRVAQELKDNNALREVSLKYFKLIKQLEELTNNPSYADYGSQSFNYINLGNLEEIIEEHS